MYTSRGKLLGRCRQCGALIRWDKPLLGSLHLCLSDEEIAQRAGAPAVQPRRRFVGRDTINLVLLVAVVVAMLATLGTVAVRCHQRGGVFAQVLTWPPYACVDRAALSAPRP